jgi:hypothetical protein
MRLKKASLVVASAAAAVAVTTMAASPAWACNDRDPALKLNSSCGPGGQPNWMVTNPNTWGAVPFTWVDNKGGHSNGKINAPAGGSVALPTHATKVVVIAYRPDKPGLPVWKNHGAFGVSSCKPSPTPTPTKTHKPTHKPTTPAPKPTATAPSGEAGPATPVKAQPNFTG